MNRPHRIRIESRGTGKDAIGGQVTTWNLLGVYWCSVRQVYGRELMAAQALHPESTHMIRMDYAPGITASHRGVFNGRFFEFKNVSDVDEAGRELQILAAEGLTAG